MAEANKNLTGLLIDGEEKVLSPNLNSGYNPELPDTAQFYCDAMNDGNINMVLNDVKPELTVLVGFSDFGKSTFIGSLYRYLLTHGGTDGYLLYDSDTYSGFERRYFLRNIKNNPTAKSKTLRTDENDDYLLTFSFYHPQLREKRQIIISDRAGETYNKYIDSDERIKNDMSLPRAQRVMIFLDASQLESEWDLLETKFESLFRRIKEEGKYPTNAEFTLVFNKYDLAVRTEKAKKEYGGKKAEVIPFFKNLLGMDYIDAIEVDSKHIRQNESFVNLVRSFLTRDKGLVSKETKLKKQLDWVAEKLK